MRNYSIGRREKSSSDSGECTVIRIIQNIRIGSKLAIAAAMNILLMVAIVYTQMTGSATVRNAYESAVSVQTIAQYAAETKASLRGMQVGIREILLAATPANLQKATGYFAERESSAVRFTEEMLKLSPDPENRERIARLTTLSRDFGTNKEAIVAARREIMSLEARQTSGSALPADATARIAALNDEIARIRRDVTVPITTECEALTNRIVELAKQRVTDANTKAVAEAASAERISLALGVSAALLLIGTCVFSVFTIARPVQALSNSMLALAEGNFEVVLPGLGRKDEIGDVAGAVDKFKAKAQQKARLEAQEQKQQERLAAEQRKKDMCGLADDFEGAVGEIIQTVSSAATEMEASANSLTTNAERTQQLSTVVAAAAEEASTNVQSVASASEEMASSVNEISRQVQESARIASGAVIQAEKTNDRVNELSEAAKKIGDVVDLINTIAGQTNLLALNATIEAARAGEAGRGFAVVASEVKSLAEQTAKATGEIGQQISAMQSATESSVLAIREITNTISRLSEISSTIAAAIEEQGAATQEISRNVQQASQGTQQVASNIADVQHGSSETGSASSQVFSAARSLSVESNRLKTEVQKFLSTVRAA